MSPIGNPAVLGKVQNRPTSTMPTYLRGTYHRAQKHVREVGRHRRQAAVTYMTSEPSR